MPWLARAACVVLLLAGCHAGNDGPGCHSDAQCKADNGGFDDRWFCDKSKAPAACGLRARQCESAADCCPGQTCKAEGHYCIDRFTSCPQNTCAVRGQVCKTVGVFASGAGCTFERCGVGGSCGDGQTCFNGYCVTEAPCNGGCSFGSVCVTATNLCSPTPKDASCQASCPAGKVLVLGNADNIFDSCNLGAERCKCESLPPLAVHDVARHSSLAAAGANLYVSAYDGEHGDLVVHTFDRLDLSRPRKSEWLDGVPPDGRIGGDVNGPRGGVVDAGPNVGQYTSIAASGSGDLYVAYYDVDKGDLKFIGRYGGQWSAPITVDGAQADVGMYASIALDSHAVAAIAYFRRASWDAATRSETGPSTALVYAVAKKPQPLSPADWTVVGDVASATRPAASTPLVDVPKGTGLMPQLAFMDDRPVIAYYDSIDRAVKAVMGSRSGAAPAFGAPVEIDGHDAAPGAMRRDTGRWPSLAIGPSGTRGGRIAIAFADLTMQRFLLYQADALSPHAAQFLHVVDDGRPDPSGPWHPQTFPGAQSSIAFTPGGKIALAYQDAAPVDLMFAIYDPATARTISRTPLRSSGAAGFWPRLTLVDGNAFVASATIKAATPSLSANQLVIDAEPAP